jgi:2-C-methyl-D-erythritol 4-phosphate cytidylyltransferase
MGGDLAKQYLLLDNRPVLVHTLEVFEKCPAIQEVVLVVKKDEITRNQEIVQRYDLQKVKHVVGGGHERQNSVFNGLKALLPDGALVVVHDGVRPLLTEEKLLAVLEAGREYGAAVLGTPVKETIKQADKNSFVLNTPPRESLWSIQTPQVFHWEVLWPAMQKAMVCGFSSTDDAGIVEWDGKKVKIVEGDYENIKITTPVDLEIARMILERRKNEGRNRL